MSDIQVSSKKLSLDKPSVSLTEANAAAGASPAALDQVTLAGGWKAGTIDVDLSTATVDASGRVLELVYYGKKSGANGAITHGGDNLTGEGEGDDETIGIRLSRLSPEVAAVIGLINVYAGESRLSNVKEIFSRVVNGDGTEIARYELGQTAGDANGLEFCEFRRNGTGWDFNVLSSPFADGLQAYVAARNAAAG